MSIDLKNQKILITGASGSLARQIIYELEGMGVKPIAHVRKSSDTSYIDSLNLEKRYADLRQEEELERLVEGVDLVIHAAAWVDFRQDRLTQFTGINTFGALNMFRASQKAGVKRFLHISTVAAVGAIRRKQNGNLLDSNNLVREETEFNLDHLRIPYIMTKHAAEQELCKIVDNGSTELVVVNPSIIVGPSETGDDRSRARKIFGRLIMPEVPIRLNLVDIRDVAPAVLAALERGRSGHRYIIAGDNITVRELVLVVSSIIGRVPHLVRIPRPAYDFAARFSVFFSKASGAREGVFLSRPCQIARL